MTPRWVGSPYAWVRELSPSQKGRLGEEMVRRLCRAAGCEVRAGSNPGHDLVVTGGDWSVRVEVKFSTLNDIAAGEPYFQWLQLRPADDFEVVALVALAPRRMRCFLLGRNEVLSRAVGHHGGGGATETRKLVVPAAEIDQAWLGPDICTETESLPSRLREVSRRRGGGRAG